MHRTTRINALDNSEKDIRSMHERVLLILGKSDYTDQEYEDALLAVQEAGWPVRAKAEDSLTPREAAKLRSDVLEQFTRQRLRDKGIDPDSANYEEYAEAVDQADAILNERENV
jgi:hypothetical protein